MSDQLVLFKFFLLINSLADVYWPIGSSCSKQPESERPWLFSRIISLLVCMHTTVIDVHTVRALMRRINNSREFAKRHSN